MYKGKPLLKSRKDLRKEFQEWLLPKSHEVLWENFLAGKPLCKIPGAICLEIKREISSRKSLKYIATGTPTKTRQGIQEESQ